MIDQTIFKNTKNEIEEWVIKVRRELHQYPELGMEEFETQRRIIAYLEEMGINEIQKVANTAVVAIIRGEKKSIEKGNDNPITVALRADMDALPIQEVEGREYGSKIPGKMHACGHDAHMAILLGVAKVLSFHKKDFAGNVKLLFQPAEETFGGAKPMIAEGVLNNPRVNVILGLHVAPELHVGEVGIRYEKMSASSDTLNIKVKGKSCHGAYPHEGVDAILIAGHILTGIQSIISRNLSPIESAVISFGKIQGGTGGNIISEEVELTGTLRTLDPEVRKRMKRRIRDFCERMPKVFGGSAEVVIEEGYDPIINDDQVTRLVEATASQILGKEKVLRIPSPSLGVEDFGCFLEEVKGCFFRLGTGNKKKGIIEPGHHPAFDIDEESLKIGVGLQVMNTLSILKGDLTEGIEDYEKTTS